MTYLSLSYDMRAPVFGADPVALYQAALDQCEWADRLGFKSVSFMEHHASSDGYLPSPMVMAAAAAARTRQMEIGVIVLLPLYDPLRLAEDLAVLDLIAGGRLRITAIAGYREEEYRQFGLRMANRPSRMERALSVLKQAWTGEPFEFEGREVRILPRPAQRPRPGLTLGGSSPAAAERAARLADGFRPVVPELMRDYAQALERLGKPAPELPVIQGGGYLFLHVTHDPDGDWEKIAPHALHENNDYARWLEGAPNPVYHHVDDPAELRASGVYRIVTPQECIGLAGRDGRLSFKPLIGGLDPALAWRSLELFEREVLPALR
jgi:alkanesulfonate monooxygenase SsuD/methylene tetrahydromethanopterin reductase-like flavin-dependent oxidoreductase (luciferase family)